MPRKKKEFIAKVTEADNKDIVQADVEKVKRALEEREEKLKVNPDAYKSDDAEFIGEKPATKSKHKFYENDGNTWSCERIVLKVDDKEYVKEFPCAVNIGKNRLGTLTRYMPTKYGKIIEVIEDEFDLKFVMKEVTPTW